MTRHKAIVIFLLAILFTGIAGSVYAQSAPVDGPELSTRQQRRKDRDERRWLRKEYKEKRRRAEEPLVARPLPAVKKYVLEYPATTMKVRYRVDVLAQMYLDDLVKGGNVTYKDRIPDKAQAGMAFYEGVNMAVDSLKKAGFKIDVYVHDIASAAESPATLMSKGMLDSSDLIIGAVPAGDLKPLADFAESKGINFISALAAADGGVTHARYFTMLQPSLRAHCEWAAKDIVTKYSGQKVIMFYRKQLEADSLAWKYVMTTEGFDKVDLRRISVKTFPSREKLLDVLDTNKTNVVIVPIMDNNYADSILRLISSAHPTARYEVYGMPTWNVGPAKKKAYPTMLIRATAPFSFDMSGASAKYVARTFKREYGGKPSEMVYRGYETFFWYANLLKRYGTVFNTRYSDNSTTPFTRFEVVPRWDKDGDFMYNENTHVYLLSSDAPVH